MEKLLTLTLTPAPLHPCTPAPLHPCTPTPYTLHQVEKLLSKDIEIIFMTDSVDEYTVH